MKKFAKIVTKYLILLDKASIFLLRKRNMNRPIPTFAARAILFFEDEEENDDEDDRDQRLVTSSPTIDGFN